VLSRFTARAEDIATSIALITHHLEHLDEPDGREQPQPAGPCASIRGRHRRRLAGHHHHRVELAEDGTLTRVKIVDPSFYNCPRYPSR